MRRGLATRRIAHDVLVRVDGSRAFADLLLGQALLRHSLSPEDRRLVTWLVYGSLAWQRRLDRAADHWVRPAMDRLDPEVRTAIRIGLLQLFLSDRIPDHAAIDTAVGLVAGHKGGAARKLVNAVLRRAVREGEPPLPKDDTAESLGIRYSHPDWLVAHWLEAWGPEETRALLQANNEPAPLVARVSGSERTDVIERLGQRGITATPTRYAPAGLRFEGTSETGLPDDPGLVIQGEASQLVALLVAPGPEDRVLDACAAPGGKALALATHRPAPSTVVACDVDREGVRRICERFVQSGMPDLRPVRADARWSPFRAASFERVLLDVPCTGTGTLRGHPEIRWRIGPDDVRDLASRQAAILEETSLCVRPGGILVYATCSLLREENDEMVEGFLRRHPEFERLPCADVLPEAARPLERHGAFRTFPHRDGLDGFYAVRLHRLVANGETLE